jgi:hypothetical protein
MLEYNQKLLETHKIKGGKNLMRRTQKSHIPISGRLLVSVPEFAEYCSCGRFTADKIAAEAGAVIFIGSRKFVNLQKVQGYLDAIAGEQM